MEHLVSLESLATTTCSELVREYNQVSVQLVQSGSYYYHYLCDGQDDRVRVILLGSELVPYTEKEWFCTALEAHDPLDSWRLTRESKSTFSKE